MNRIKRIAVFCGSSNDVAPEYFQLAEEFASLLASEGIGIVFGGGRVGMMGKLADAALAKGGEVIGVIPDKLHRAEVAHEGVTQLHVVHSMHQRKFLMATYADAFVALPGGFGTFEEMFEVVTWNQIGYHAKPCALLNGKGYFDHLLAFVQRGIDDSFIRPQHRDLLLSADDGPSLLQKIREADMSEHGKWLGVSP